MNYRGAQCAISRYGRRCRLFYGHWGTCWMGGIPWPDACGTISDIGPNGMIRECLLSDGHDGLCVFLALTERMPTWADTEWLATELSRRRDNWMGGTGYDATTEDRKTVA